MGATHPLLESGVAKAIIGGTLVGVFQDLIGLVDFLETHLAGLIPRIAVGMEFHRELAKGRLEPGIVGIAFDFERLVIAALGGHCELGLSNRGSGRSPRNDIGSRAPHNSG